LRLGKVPGDSQSAFLGQAGLKQPPVQVGNARHGGYSQGPEALPSLLQARRMLLGVANGSVTQAAGPQADCVAAA